MSSSDTPQQNPCLSWQRINELLGMRCNDDLQLLFVGNLLQHLSESPQCGCMYADLYLFNQYQAAVGRVVYGTDEVEKQIFASPHIEARVTRSTTCLTLPESIALRRELACIDIFALKYLADPFNSLGGQLDTLTSCTTDSTKMSSKNTLLNSRNSATDAEIVNRAGRTTLIAHPLICLFVNSQLCLTAKIPCDLQPCYVGITRTPKEEVLKRVIR